MKLKSKSKPIGIVHSTKIITSINNMIEMKMMRFEGGSVHLFADLIPESTRSVYIKNLFLYARIMGHVEKGQALLVKDIETGSRIAYYQGDRAVFDK